MAICRRQLRACAALLALVAAPAGALDNGLALTPPQGWRSWNSYTCQDSTNTTFTGGDIISDAAMRTAMHAVLDTSRSVGGKPTTLASLGYSYVSMDDGWQQCNCSTHQDIDPSLPSCSIGDCRGGRCSWHNKPDGAPMVNKHRFPDGMKALVDYGHSLGLKVGSYLNNCICMDKDHEPKYEQDVKWFMDAGFDEVKIDNCGSSHNVTYYSELFNATGKAIRIEDCHTSPAHPDVLPDGSISCPMNMYRAGGDIKASFGSIIGEIYSTVLYNDRKRPLSFPGCWAYPDMMQVGNFHGEEPLRSAEERTHFSLWALNSAPLVLGFDMGNASHMDRVWPWITNPDMLAISHAWDGHPGTLVKAFPAVGLPVGMTTLGECSAANPGSTGWALRNGSLLAPASSSASAQLQPQCMVGIQHSGVVNENAFTCPPATTANTEAPQCGNMIFNCSDVGGVWSHQATGELAWAQAADKPATQKCLRVTPGVVADDRNGSKADPEAASMKFVPCAVDGKTKPDPAATFTLGADGSLKVGTGGCVGVGDAPGVQLWTKPMKRGSKVAFLVLNPLPIAQTLSLPLADVPGNPCQQPQTACTLRDVWAAKEQPLGSQTLPVTLQPHESMVWILSTSA